MITLLIPVIGFLYTDRYRQLLIEGELEALRSEGRIIAVALGWADVSSEDPEKHLDEPRQPVPASADHRVRRGRACSPSTVT